MPFLAGCMLATFFPEYKYLNSTYTIDPMNKIEAVVVDGDGTMWKRSTTEALGRWYLVKAVRELQFRKVANCALGMASAELMLIVRGASNGIPHGQKKFYDMLVENGMGMKEEMHEIVGGHMRNNVVERVGGIVNYYVAEGIPAFLATMAGSTTADYAKYNFRLTDTVSNAEIFDNSGKLIGFDARITCGESKLAHAEEALGRHGLKLWNCIAIGDSVHDIPMLKSAKIAMASPFASEKVLALKRIVRLEKE